MNSSALESTCSWRTDYRWVLPYIVKLFLPPSDKGDRWLPAASVLYLTCPAQQESLDCGSQEIQVGVTSLLHCISYQTCKLGFESCFEFQTLTHQAKGNSRFLDPKFWFKPILSCEGAARLLLRLSSVQTGRSLWGVNGPFWLFSAPWSQSEHLYYAGACLVGNVLWEMAVLSFQNLFLWKKVSVLKRNSTFHSLCSEWMGTSAGQNEAAMLLAELGVRLSFHRWCWC